MAKAALADLPVSPGQVIGGRYAISGVIGVGGMGVVLAGKHLELGERVAIKFLHKEHAAHADRFFREARAAARIRSEHVVRIYDVGRLPTGEPYIVMENLKGEDLAARLAREGMLPPQKVADTLLDVCQALAEAHASGIVHRDLKPANIFLARGPGGVEIVKLLDFGVAKVPEGGSITKTASILGSPVYMSPEQLMASRDVDARSDIWSLGIILFELLTNALPFEGDSLVHLGIIVREKPTPKVRTLRPEVPEGLDDAIAKCLAKDKADRFADVAEFAEALVPFASAGFVHSTPRIRRVLDEAARQGRTELASTIPPPSEDEDIHATELDEQVAATRPTAQLSASLVAVSSQIAMKPASAPDTQPSPEPARPKKSRLGFALAIGAAVGLTAAVLSLAAGPFAKHTSTASSSPAEPLASPPSTWSAPQISQASVVPPAAPAPSPSIDLPPTASAAAPASVARPAGKRAPSRVPPPSAATTPAASSAATADVAPTPKPAPNCNPPYTIDENNLRRPKPECL